MNGIGKCLHAGCGLESIMFIRQQQREGEMQTQVQTGPTSLVTDALMGVDGG